MEKRDRLKPVHARHGDIQQDHIWPRLARDLYRFDPVARFADNLEPRFGESQSEQLSQRRDVVDDEHPYGQRRLLSDKMMSTEGFAEQYALLEGLSREGGCRP